MTQIPPTSPGAMGLRPHRGVIILVLGILGIVLCFICGIIAWVMGNGDIREMQAGRMDPSGLGLTKAGKICGIVGVALTIIGGLFWVLMVVVFAGAAAAGAAGGAAP